MFIQYKLDIATKRIVSYRIEKFAQYTALTFTHTMDFHTHCGLLPDTYTDFDPYMNYTDYERRGTGVAPDKGRTVSMV